MKHLALIQGINIGGHHPMKMDQLQETVESLGFEDVSTYIQSGNVIFDAPASQTALLSGIVREKIKDVFGYDVPVMVRTIPEIESILQQDPFAEHEREGQWNCYISFLPEKPEERKVQNLITLKSEAEVFGVNGREVYTLIDKNSHKKPLFSNNFIEQQLALPATTRNRRTIHDIISTLLST